MPLAFRERIPRMAAPRRSPWVLASALSLAALEAGAASRQPASLTSGGERRDYILVAPDTAPDGPRPLVLVLHGHLGTAANALGDGSRPSPLSAWVDIVDREKILVVAPQGLKGADNQTGWHDCRRDDTNNPRSDDVAFISAVVRQLVADKRADPARIYAMGMSNGAMMSLRLALEMQPAPAAIVAASGTMAAQSECAGASRPVSVMVMHGTDDPLAPYTGGTVGARGRGRGSVTSVEATRDFWLKANGLTGATPTQYEFPHGGNDATRAIKTSYGDDAGPQVVVLTIRNGGHVEPSRRFHYGRLYSRLVGQQNRDLESADEAWSFFRSKSRR
jgi:polyhydroxybutyrate depolymerase